MLAGCELRAKEISILRAVLLVLVEQEEDLVWYFTFYLDAPANQDDACKSRKLSIYERGNPLPIIRQIYEQQFTFSRNPTSKRVTRSVFHLSHLSYSFPNGMKIISSSP